MQRYARDGEVEGDTAVGGNRSLEVEEAPPPGKWLADVILRRWERRERLLLLRNVTHTHTHTHVHTHTHTQFRYVECGVCS